MWAAKLIANLAPLSPISPIFSSIFYGGVVKKKDGQTLPINRRQRAYNNGTLIIEQLQRLEDAGTYTCMAQNKQKQTSRRNVEIQVLGECVSLCFPIFKIRSASGNRSRSMCRGCKKPLQLLQ